MYAKIIRLAPHGNTAVISKNGLDEVVPTINYVYEAEKIGYRKVRVFSHEEFEESLKRLEDHSVVGDFPEDVRSDGSFEYIILQIDDKVTVFLNSTLYIMNDRGKTIDSLVCY